jgi:hypothetical protein
VRFCDTLTKENTLTGTREYYEELLEIIQRLTEKEPNHSPSHIMQALSDGLDRLGDILAKNDDPTNAKTCYAESLKILRRQIVNEAGESPFGTDGKPLEVRPRVVGVKPDSQAARLGITEGDFFLDLDGIVLPTHTRFIDYRDREHSDGPAKKLRILRGAEILTVELEPGRIGVQLAPAFVPEVANEGKK